MRGINPKIISQILGHRDPGFTLKAYTHVTSGMQEQARKNIEDISQE